MTLRNTQAQYGSLAKFFHWTISSLVILMLMAGTTMMLMDDSPLREQIFHIHKLTGLVILLLMILRGLWALNNPKPLLPPTTKAWERLAEHTMHLTLYIVLFAMPLSGWIMSTASGYIPSIYGLEIPFFWLGKNKAIAEAGETVHLVLAWSILVLVSMHILAALKHHFVDKDNILIRMMPNKKS